MTLAQKFLLGSAAVLIAGAASFPNEVSSFYKGGYPEDSRQRAALQLCHETNPNFIRFLQSDRAACYASVKGLAGIS